MSSITIEMPHPPRCLSPNGRAHWGQKSKVGRQFRNLASNLFAIADESTDVWPRAKMTIRWFHKTMRFPDTDNVIGSCKWIRDGIADTGIVENDRDITDIRVLFVKDKARPRVEITLEEIESEAA